MNTSKLQAFATDARRQLMNAVQARLDAALVPNSDAQVDDPRAFDFLQREIGQAGGGVEGRRHVVERYAYRWFNRIIAFRYMDVHGFTGTPVGLFSRSDQHEWSAGSACSGEARRV